MRLAQGMTAKLASFEESDGTDGFACWKCILFLCAMTSKCKKRTYLVTKPHITSYRWHSCNDQFYYLAIQRRPHLTIQRHSRISSTEKRLTRGTDSFQCLIRILGLSQKDCDALFDVDHINGQRYNTPYGHLRRYQN